MIQRLTAGLGLAILAACGPLNEGNAARGALKALGAQIGGLVGNAPAAPAPAAPVLTRAQADANPGAFLLVTAYGGASEAAMVQVKVTNQRVTWISADNATVTLEDGLIVATRGFPRDLMAADPRGIRQAIAAGGGRGQRVHETLTDLDQISTILLQCRIATEGSEVIQILGKAVSTRRVSEICEGESITFTNTYWLDDAGVIARSRQAVSPETGYLILEKP